MFWILLIISVVCALFSVAAILGNIFFMDFDELPENLLKLLIFGLILAVSVLGFGWIEANRYDATVQTEEYKLISLADSSEISGSGSGGIFYAHMSIDTDEVYTFYYETENGIKRGKISAEDTVIFEEDNCTPHLIKNTVHEKNKINKVLRIILGFGFGESTRENYELHVPTGTILITNSLDNK